MTNLTLNGNHLTSELEQAETPFCDGNTKESYTKEMYFLDFAFAHFNLPILYILIVFS